MTRLILTLCAVVLVLGCSNGTTVVAPEVPNELQPSTTPADADDLGVAGADENADAQTPKVVPKER